MSSATILIRTQKPSDEKAIANLHCRAFGPGRFARTAYRIREGCITEPTLNLCALVGEEMIGAIQFTPISIGGEKRALLLGPLVVTELYKNQGFGLKLMAEGLGRGKSLGYLLAILVGDLPYYARAGFKRAPEGWISLPGPVDPARLLYAELEADALPRFRGEARGIST
jgi:predicted N-acetyltransferase YhbS